VDENPRRFSRAMTRVIPADLTLFRSFSLRSRANLRTSSATNILTPLIRSACSSPELADGLLANSQRSRRFADEKKLIFHSGHLPAIKKRPAPDSVSWTGPCSILRLKG
jgi:hypothetical protein